MVALTLRLTDPISRKLGGRWLPSLGLPAPSRANVQETKTQHWLLSTHLKTSCGDRKKHKNGTLDSKLENSDGVGRYGVVWYGVVWYGAMWYGVVWCGVVWCGVVWCGVVWCGVVWCGVVWCGVVWDPPRWQGLCYHRAHLWAASDSGVVWCGVVWCGVVWCGVVCRRRCYQKAKAGMSTHG